MKLRGFRLGRVALRDQRVGICRIADHEHAHVAVGDCVERLALRGKDLCVGEQQVLALHAGSARSGTHQQRKLAALEGDRTVVGRNDAVQRGERTVIQFHHDAPQRVERWRDLEQVQVDGLVRAQHLAGSNAEREGIADLARCTGDGDVDWGLHEVSPLVIRCPRAGEGPYARSDVRRDRNLNARAPASSYVSAVIVTVLAFAMVL